MSIIHLLASSLGRRDEIPNQELARQIAANSDKEAVKELVALLDHKDKNIQSDSIKVLYETGEANPRLITPYDKAFIALLASKNNRLIWGAMTALDAIASVNSQGIYEHLGLILDAADKGSVITKDHGVSILIKLAKENAYADQALTLLLEQLRCSAVNQLPMYAENAVPAITPAYRQEFIAVLLSRLPEIDKESKQKRVEKVIKKIASLL